MVTSVTQPLEGIPQPSSYWHQIGKFGWSLHTEKSSWVMDNSKNSWALAWSPGIAQALSFFPASFYSSDNIEQFLLCQGNLWSLIPNWARPVRAIILVSATAKCKNPVNHEILSSTMGIWNLTPQISSNPFNLCSGPVVRPDLWMVQLPGLYFIVGKGRRRKRCLWEGSSEHSDDTNTSEIKV